MIEHSSKNSIDKLYRWSFIFELVGQWQKALAIAAKMASNVTTEIDWPRLQAHLASHKENLRQCGMPYSFQAFLNNSPLYGFEKWWCAEFGKRNDSLWAESNTIFWSHSLHGPCMRQSKVAPYQPNWKCNKPCRLYTIPIVPLAVLEYYFCFDWSLLIVPYTCLWRRFFPDPVIALSKHA